MKLAKWTLINGLFVICLYFGYVEGVEGARNVALFYAWFVILTWFFVALVNADEMVLRLKEDGRSAPRFIFIALHLLITACFAWFGAWITAIFYILHVVIGETLWSKSQEIKEEKSENA